MALALGPKFWGGNSHPKTRNVQGPDEKQITFFDWLETNYDFFIKKISPAIEKIVAKWIKYYQIQDFKQEFMLEYIYIPRCEKAPFEWVIVFYAKNELQHTCTL